jgi:hypothetical protein
MTHKDLEVLAGAVVTVMKQALNARVGPLEQRVLGLEGKALGGKPHLKFRDAWRTGEAYALDDAVTYQKSLWICRRPGTSTEPGVDPYAWQRYRTVSHVD